MLPEETPPLPRYGRDLRPLWLLDPAATFLNHGSYGACPRAVLAAQRQWRDRLEAQPVRFMHDVLPGALRDSAAALAGFLGVQAEDRAVDLVFVENATSGVNAVLRSLTFGPGDEVLTTSHVYPAVRNAIRQICGSAGASPIEAPIPFPLQSPQQAVDAIAAALGPRTRLVVIDAVTSPTAVVLPVAEIAARCRAAGVRLLVDAAHAPGMIPLDVAALGADWVTGNAHKWLFAPKGCAFLWARKEAQEGLHPVVISHGLGHGFAAEFDWVGTRDPSAWLAAGAALDFWRALGGPALMARNRALADEAARMLAEAWGTEIGAPAAMRGAMATIRLPLPGTAERETGLAINRRLWAEHRVEVPIMAFAGRLWARISAQAYNDLDDYRRLADAVRAMRD
jgi:isopenicillin-N epimerase